MKLELKHLAGYLPYGLKVIFESKGGRILEVTGLRIAGVSEQTSKLIYFNSISETLNIEYFKPILRPLSDLTKEIEVNGETSNYLIEIMKIKNNGDWLRVQQVDFMNLPYYLIEKLFEWHFDIYGLIENGLAIDINTIK